MCMESNIDYLDNSNILLENLQGEGIGGEFIWIKGEMKFLKRILLIWLIFDVKMPMREFSAR